MTDTRPRTDPRALLPALWTFVMLNYLYADVVGLMDPILLPQYLRGEVDALRITRPLLLAASVMMEVPIAMTLLSRIVGYRWNRRLNLAAGAFKTLAVLGSLAVGVPPMHYVFFATIEIATTVSIVLIAWRWRPPAQCQPIARNTV